MNRKYSRWSLCGYVSCCLKEKIITLRVRPKQILKRRQYWNVPERLWDERLRPSCVIACFKGTSPGGVHWTFVVRRCCSKSHLWGSSCIDLRLLQLSNMPTCQSVKFSMSIAVYSITMCYPGAVEVCHGSLKNMIVQESAVESGQIILHNMQGNFLFSDNTSRYAMSLRFSMFTFHYKGT